MVVGLTGGIGSGKSTVAAMFAELGVAVIDADRLARAALEPGGPAQRAVLAAFGPAIAGAGGRIDRAALRRQIFADPAARRRLEAIVHPAVMAAMTAEIERLRSARPDRLIVCDVPLLFEAGVAGRFDRVVVVVARPEVQRARLAARDGEAADRDAEIAAQMPLAEKAARADHVIDNSGDREATRRQVAELADRLMGAGTRRSAASP